MLGTRLRVHSFTDLGLSGQLLGVSVVFAAVAAWLVAIRWKKSPLQKEINTYSREFWIFLGATILCLMGFQVMVPTSYPVYNKVVGLLGGILLLAIPGDQLCFLFRFQLWFAVAVGLLSGTAQFFWWKRIDR